MKSFIACLGTETNTFSPMPTGWQTFKDTMLFYGDATRHAPSNLSLPLFTWREASEAVQFQVVESVAAYAAPAGITVRAVYEELRDRLLDDLAKAIPLNMVLLSMHGAMIAEGCDDCEGDTLSRVRALVGPDVTIGVRLDLHCSITELMLHAADAIVTFKEYPHIDGVERAKEVFDICYDKLKGRTRPVMAATDCHIINLWRTPDQPVKSFVARMQELEGKDGILSISFAHGFPWGDVPDASAKILVIADGDGTKAQAIADRLAGEIWQMREACVTKMATMDEALLRAQQAAVGPIVLADVSDNAGGGAPSDSTFLLRTVLDQGIANVLSGHYWDPIAVRFCVEAGEGASLDLRIGGKCGPMSGDPLDLRVVVKKIVERANQSFGQSTRNMGTAVWAQADNGIDLLLNTLRTQCFHPDAFIQMGIDVSAKKIILVKSTQHFYAGFEPIAKEIIYVSAPGAITPNFAAIPYRKFSDPYWPRESGPFT